MLVKRVAMPISIKIGRYQKVDRIAHIRSIPPGEPGTDERKLLRKLCRCLDGDEIERLLFSSLDSDLLLRDISLQVICENLADGNRSFGRRIISRLLRLVPKAKYRERESYGLCLSKIGEVCDTRTRRRIQRYFLASPYTRMRQRGYKSLSAEGRRIPKHLVLRSWNSWRDPASADLLIQHFSPTFLEENRVGISEVLTHPSEVARLYIRIGQESPDVTQNLRDWDAITYCYVSAKLGRRIHKSIARKYLKRNLGNERLGILLWAFAKMRFWDLLEEVRVRLPEVHTRRHTTPYSGVGI